jgi:hypothetical protein
MRIFVFSTMKAGTMFLHQLLKDISRLSNVPHYSHNYDPKSPYYIPSAKSPETFTTLLESEGCFGPFRHYIPIPDRENAKIILHFRDPRDTMSSLYFYLAYHQKYIPQVIRDTYIKRGIDRFVFNPHLPTSHSWYQRTKQRIKMLLKPSDTETVAEWLLKDYQLYFRNYYDLDNTRVTTYEEMVTSFPVWLEHFLESFELENEQKIREELITIHQDSFIPPSPEQDLNKIKHKRKITPGDYKQQFSTQTIVKLNQFFSEPLSRLGYK